MFAGMHNGAGGRGRIELTAGVRQALADERAAAERKATEATLTACPWCRKGERHTDPAGTCAGCGVPWNVDDWRLLPWEHYASGAIAALLKDRAALVKRLEDIQAGGDDVGEF